MNRRFWSLHRAPGLAPRRQVLLAGIRTSQTISCTNLSHRQCRALSGVPSGAGMLRQNMKGKGGIQAVPAQTSPSRKAAFSIAWELC